MKKIIAIGGGELRDRDTLSIDKRILELTGKASPDLLFIPTASNDAEGYIQTVQKIYQEELGAKVDVLKLISESPSAGEIEDKILSADAIYVGGGNTRKMLDTWHSKGVDHLLKSALERGTVLSGLSAGAICWFEFGSTDSPRFDNPEDKELVLMKGLGFANGLLSPHHIREPYRTEKLPELIAEAGVVGLGVDDNAAIELLDDKFRVIASKDGVGVTKFFYDLNGELHKEFIEPSENWEVYSEIISIK